MAALLDEMASKLTGILVSMAKKEVEMLLGVPGEITKLETTLGDLSSILADAERKRIRDSTTQRWVRVLKDVMYDADDVLDLCQIMEGGEDPTAPTSAPKATSMCWDIPKMLFCFRNPIVAHDIGRKIQAVNQQLEDLAKRSSRFGFITQAINSSDSISRASYFSSSKTGSGIVKSDVVGEKIEANTKRLVDILVKKVDGAPVGLIGNDLIVDVAITGAGGIGKTTLARMIFSDSRVEEKFEDKIWLSVNQDVNEISLLQSLLASFGAKHEGFAGDRGLLERALKDTVHQKKFLLVMDDVWSEKVWNELLSVPLSYGASGSCVLVTTRNDGVARGMKAQHLHRVDKLEMEDAWILLKSQVVLDESDEADVDGLKDVGMKILERCDGLPLAVKVLAGLLRRKSRTPDAWMDVSSHYTWSTTGIDEHINKAVYLSYEELPSHLKQCFVYCSLVPKDELIRSRVIVRLWMAEGYLCDKMSSRQPEDLGLEYYKELVSRNLLEPNEGSYSQSHCTMHDVVRYFAHCIIKEEGVLITEGHQDVNRTLGTTKLRHLSISNKAVGLGTLQKQVSLRTLMLFGSTTVELKDLLNKLSSLRVLYLDNVNLVELPDTICQLKHLRCLYLCSTSISTIPRDIGDQKFLQVIDLFGCKNVSKLPSSIMKLRKLRSLILTGTTITSIPRAFRKLEDLVHLLGFPTHSDDSSGSCWCSLEELGPLSKLKVLEICNVEKAPSGSMASKAMLSSKHHLRDLDLIFTSRLGENGVVEDDISEEEHEAIEDVLANLCPPTCTEELDIIGYFGRGLPQWMKTMSGFRGLRRLLLKDYACCTQLPNALGQLPHLDFFWIKRAPSVRFIGHQLILPSLGTEADSNGEAPVLTGTRNRRMQSHSRVAFPKLVSLGFEGMLGWTEWEWEQSVPAMPVLEELDIHNCKLQRLPAGLEHHARRLRKLNLRNVQSLVSVENFPSLVELSSHDNARLERIRNNPSLQWIGISRCPAIKELDGSPSLRSLEWWDLDAEALPEYLLEANLKKLRVDCSQNLLRLIVLQDESSESEWSKIQHVQQLKAYGHKTEEEVEVADESHSQEDERAEWWYIHYTKEPYSFDAYLGESTGDFIFYLVPTLFL
ncbi:hypothetical protein HU200_045292 [Digitaria exilis]|uniref:Uncharacterized protein n=1 Tax=Digitaria exilis TaxID=1010633 RepID=A0A835EAF0_9POAL|nr:hypothetical protein HU200_045292 [Digitaria exilis]